MRGPREAGGEPWNKPAGDSVIEEQAARLEQTMDLAEIIRQLAVAHVLKHSYANNLVKRFGRQIAIVAELNAHSLHRACSRVLDLVRAERNAENLGLVPLRSMRRQASPATADVKQLFAWLQSELGADVMELPFL